MNHSENLDLKNIEGEIWKDIPGFEGLYQASNLGRIKSLERWYQSANLLKMPENIKKQKPNVGGYWYLHLCKNGKKWATSVHKLIALTFIGPKPYEKATVNHIDSNKLNNRAENLEYCSIKENIQHHRKNVNDYIGINHPMARLTEKDILDIREEYKTSKILQKDMAKRYNVSQVMISRIIKRKTWTHI